MGRTRDKKYHQGKIAEIDLKEAVKTARAALKKFREKQKK